MESQRFGLWILILAIGFMQWFYVVQRHFGGEAEMRVTIGKLREKLEQERLSHALARQQMREFKQAVAAILPDIEDEDREMYQVRNLASIVVNPDLDRIKIEKASTLFERGKERFRTGEYERANEIFSTLIRNYPDSIHVVESYFFYSEGHYKEGQYEECLKTIDSMVSLFPEHELTGFSLLRMGQILTTRDRVEDAEQIYRTVLQNFNHPSLNEEAQRLLKEITL